jgi:hypothetical protein
MKMTNKLDVSAAIKPKSDQLNADDLVGGPITVTITSAHVLNTKEQPITLGLSGGYLPYKPCKGMARALAQIWSKYADEWVGRSLTLYRDPSVTWAGVAVGGIRISHASHIDSDIVVAVTIAKSKRTPMKIKRLSVQQPAPSKQPAQLAPSETLPPYPEEQFDKNFAAWAKAVGAGKLTPQQVVDRASKTGTLNEEQTAAILSLGNVD